MDSKSEGEWILVRTWLDSGANAFSMYESSFKIRKDEWELMSEKQKEDYAREVAWERMDWGFHDDR